MGTAAEVLKFTPVISYFQVDRPASTLAKSNTVILNNTVGGGTPVEYMASNLRALAALSGSPARRPHLSPQPVNHWTDNFVYFKVKDGSGERNLRLRANVSRNWECLATAGTLLTKSLTFRFRTRLSNGTALLSEWYWFSGFWGCYRFYSDNAQPPSSFGRRGRKKEPSSDWSDPSLAGPEIASVIFSGSNNL